MKHLYHDLLPQQFDHVLNRLFDLLVDRDPDLARNRRQTRTMLFYMYWNCDIGKDDPDA